ncbi:lysylphosphatidylglycerol synthase domain-containing protein [Mumia sp. DW29H23]|uniref:lysylphosphatidylglycerol synthase domain-containing protein n=1 Tax=Mumia sp. DW29H23 TaxID=3421241 RepID=UPI003D69A0B8
MNRSSRTFRSFRTLVLLAASLLLGWFIIGRVGTVDWDDVGDALATLTVWQLVVLLGLVVVRQVLSGVPTALFVPGLGMTRAVVSDQAAMLMRVVAPPPADTAIRLTMLSRWGVEPPAAVAGVVMTKVAHNTVRWSAPVIGFVLVLTDRFDSSFGAGALAGGSVAAVILVAVYLVARGRTTARRVGHAAGRGVRTVRRSVDPEEWEAAAAAFREQISGRLSTGLPRSLAALMAMLVCDAAILLLSVRFVGIGADALPASEAVAAYLLVYPMTLLPIFGIGVLDASAVAIMVAYAGPELEGALVAALFVWRTVTIGAALVLGGAAVVVGRLMPRV